MTFPTVIDSITNDDSTENPNRSVSIPSGSLAGEMLLAFVYHVLNSDATWPVGWEEFFSQVNINGNWLRGAWKRADGNDTSPITVTLSGGTFSAHNAYRISGASFPPEAAVAVSETIDNNANPPNLTTTGGEKEYLWIAVAAVAGTAKVTAPPSGYTDFLIDADSGHGSAIRLLKSASENPGVFTSDAYLWIAATIAVSPISIDSSVTANFGSIVLPGRNRVVSL